MWGKFGPNFVIPTRDGGDEARHIQKHGSRLSKGLNQRSNVELTGEPFTK
jgi:hypothetical protein